MYCDSASDFDLILLDSIRQYLLEADFDTIPGQVVENLRKNELHDDAINVDQWINFDQLFDSAEETDAVNNASFPSFEVSFQMESTAAVPKPHAPPKKFNYRGVRRRPWGPDIRCGDKGSETKRSEDLARYLRDSRGCCASL
ncbi:hypothetical protein V6Z12_D08G071500 [Gossypium hirsutum]